MKTYFKILYIVLLLASGLEAYSQTVTWQREYPRPFNVYGTCITQTFDGGFVMCGQTKIQSSPIFVLRTNYLGDTLWSKLFAGNYILKIIQTHDSNFVLGGTEGENASLLKISQNGDFIWLKQFDLHNNDVISDISEASNQSLLCFGSSGSVRKSFLLKTNLTGDFLWVKYYDSMNVSGLMTKYSGNRLLLTGARSGGTRAAVVDTSGNLVRLSGFPLQKGVSDSVTKNFYFIKDTLGARLEFIKFDSSFNIVTAKVIDLPDNSYKYFHLLKNFQGIVVCGYTYNTDPLPFLTQLDNDGIVLWIKAYPVANHFSSFDYVSLCSDKGLITTGIFSLTLSDGGIHNIWATKTDTLGNTNFVSIINHSNYNPENYMLYQNYPNPFNPKTIINFELRITNFVTLKVYDVLGNEVAILVNQKQNAGTYSVDWNALNFPSGVYFYTINAGDFKQTKRMILLK